jgi:hypothetical protein
LESSRAQPGKSRDKAKVEAGVRFAQTYILGRLRAQTFFSLAECNEVIKLVMQRMNERTMRHLGLSRRELFEKVERAALNGLPAEDREFAEWRRGRVNPARALARRSIITSRSMTSSIRFLTR